MEHASSSTEIGAAVRLIPNPKTMEKTEWDYFQISPHIDIRMIPQEGQPGIFEPVAFVRLSCCNGETKSACL